MVCENSPIRYYDSFTFNLFHYLEAEGERVDVFRNDEISLEDLQSYDAVVLSPGPGLPKDAGIMPAFLKSLDGSIPVLGVCLGLQGIVERFGGTLRNLEEVIHGQATSCIQENEDVLFEGISSPFQIGHYHSWVANEIPSCLEVTSRNEEGLIMSVRHKEWPIHAVQFHPESVLTPNGRKMIQNWVSTVKNKKQLLSYENNY
ncbi:MAG: aminodeoxychorismate/anthranilate synthase component II [Flavobacteriales bacterium]